MCLPLKRKSVSYLGYTQMNFIPLLIYVFISLAINTFILDSATEMSFQKSRDYQGGERLVIRNVNLLTMTDRGDKILKNHSVVIEGSKIIKIAPDSLLSGVDDALVINGECKYLLPGLIDAHVHIWDEAELSAYLAFGVTTVRNASGMPFHLEFSEKIENDHLQGPRLLTTGPILNGQGPNTQVNHQIINNAGEARQAVREQYEQGYRHLKVYSNLSREAYEAVLSESRKLGMTIMGHTPEGVRTQGIPFSKPFHIEFTELLDDGFVSIEHMESIVWHGLYDELDEVKTRQLAREIASSSTAVTPTLIAHRNLVLVAQSQGQYLKRPGVELLNPYISAFEKESYEYWSNQAPGTRKDYDTFYLRATRIFQEEGVTLLTGTDSGIFTNIPGQSLVEELKLFVKAGLTPYQALKASTVNPAQVLGIGDKTGRIKVGYTADLILVDGDPTKDIAKLDSLSGVVVRGKWYNARKISKLEQQASNTSYERTERRVREGLDAQGSSLD